MVETPKLGGDIDAYCNKCKMELNHRITAMVEGKVVKVACNTCKTEHAYRAKAPKTAAKKRTTRTRSKLSQAEVAEAEFNRLLGKRDTAKAKAYALTSIFDEGDLIKHHTFGIGIVTTVKADNKIVTMFKDKLRILVHRRGVVEESTEELEA